MMTYFLFNRKHLKEYIGYGIAAGACHALTVWYFLDQPGNAGMALLFIGSIFFMFVIMVYAIKLTKRLPDHNRTWGMLISGQIAVLSGVVISVILATILCLIYMPKAEAIALIFVTATFENYGAGAFISAMIAYALKPDQTDDITPEIFEERSNENPASQEIVRVGHPFHDRDITDGSEFLDDAIRMSDH